MTLALVPIGSVAILNVDLTVVLSVASEGSGLVSTTSVTKAVSCELLATFLILCRFLAKLTNCDELQVVLLSPVDQGRSESLHRAGVGLVHEGNVTVSTSTSLLELLQTLLGRLAIPVARVNIISDDLVSELLHGGQDIAAGSEVWRSHVGGLLADDVDEGLLHLLHLLLQPVGAETAEVLGVSPGVTGDLVARVVGLLDGGLLVVDAAVERAGQEEGGLGTGVVEDVDELAGVLSRAVIVGESKDTGSGALADDNTSGLAVEELNWVLDSSAGNGANEQESADSSLEE